MDETDRMNIQFAEKHGLKKMAKAIRDGMDYSFVIKKAVEEVSDTNRLVSWIFRSDNTSIAYYLIKNHELTFNQQAEIALFLVQKEDYLRLIDIVKSDLITGGVLSIITEMIYDFETLLEISKYAHVKKLDVGQKKSIVHKIFDIGSKSEIQRFKDEVRWYSDHLRN